ncbi:MAG TPA: metalloregulator ArsR/SmtB family transcription factor [Polyangiaceae bacterium]|nr:metalloregulator ArsR/SmtB family transcription factor [Polyangiaceae bacterium]
MMSRSAPAPAAGLDAVLLALADPTRRAILERLSRGQARVTDLAQPFSISLNSVSKHIRVLERAKLVQRRVRGREHVLSIDPKPLDHAAAWIDAQRALWARRLQTLDDLLQEEDRAHARARKGRR